MSEKVIVLQSKEHALDAAQHVQDAGIRIKSRFGTFIIVQQPEASQEAELATHGIELQSVEDATSDLSQFSEEDRLLMGAFLLRRTGDYQSPGTSEASEEEEMMLHTDCGEEEH